MQQDDNSLIEQARSGDSEALTALIRRHHNAVLYSLLDKFPQDWQGILSAEDVLQQTYTDVFLEIGRFVPSGPNSFVSWVRRMAQNDLHDTIRNLEADKRGKGARRVLAPEGQTLIFFEQLMGSVSSRTSPTRIAAQNELEEMLSVALGKLPDLYATVVRRYDLEGHSAADIAADMGRSPGAIHLLRVRAHRRLRELLSQHSVFFQNSA